ncbi:MAG: GTP-binding protein [Candidatus Lokiarchaeota archaeon]
MKILVTGPVQSGKSSYIKKFDSKALNVEARGSDNKSYTVGMDLGSIRMNGFYVYLFGTPGLLRFSVMRDVVTSGSDGVIFIFDSAHPEKDELALSILNSIRSKLPSNIPIVFLANKQDLPNARTPEVIRAQNNLKEESKIFPSSVKTGLNIEKSLKYLINEIFENYQDLLAILKKYENDIQGLAKKMKKNKIELRDLLNRLEVKRFIELDRAHKTYKVKEGLKFLM